MADSEWEEVTDPEELKMLGEPAPANSKDSGWEPVTDPNELKQIDKPKEVDTFLGKMPSREEFQKYINDPALLKDMINTAAGGPGMKLVGRGLGAIGAGIRNTIANARSDISPLEQQAAKAAEESKVANQADIGAKEQAKINQISPDAERAQAGSLTLQDRIQHLYAQLAAKAHNLTEDISGSHANVENAQKAHQEANKIASDIDSNISSHLNEGAQHDVRTASGVFEKADAERKALSKGYKDLEKDFEQRQVPVNNEAAIQEKTDEIHNLIKGGNARSPEMDAVLKDLDALKSETPKTAKDYLHTLQSIKDYARTAREKAFSTGMNRAERIEHENAFNALDEKAEEISKVLEENIGPENAQKLKELNNGWRTRVVPLQRNNVYQKIKYEGKMSDNIMKELRGNKNPGNQIIKEFIQNDPELLKNVVGQRYAGKVAGLHGANETAMEYINKMPELKDMIQQRAYAQNAIPIAEKKVAEAAASHKETLANHAKNLKSSEERSGINQEIADIQEKLPTYDKTINELRQKKSQRDISLGKKVKYESEYQKALKAKKSAQARLKTIGYVAATPVIGYPAIKVGSAIWGGSKGEKSGD